MRIRLKRSRRIWLGVVISFGIATASMHFAEAQVAPARFFDDPLLIFGSGGHHAPVRSMVFATRDGSQLLTGGMDKIVNVWNLDVDRSGPAQTLRPPNWRGFRGQINAIALSSPDADGNRLLAVAGYGVFGALGEILLFRYPNPAGQGTGDIVGQLSASTPQPGQPAKDDGHSSAVTSLAFTPDGKRLVSASLDRTMRIWDVPARIQVSVMKESTAEINSMAIFANGTRLVSGCEDGTVRLHNIANPAVPVLVATAVNPAQGQPPRLPRILSVAASPDSRWIVVGTSRSRLIRYDAANLRGDTSLKAANDPMTGPILAVAISPDGTRLASSSVWKELGANDAAGIPDVTSYVEIRSMSDGRFLERFPAASNLVQALAFSPDGRRLAYSGGDAQAVYVKEMAQGAPAPDEIKGKGASLWDVGFRADGRAIRFARTRPAVPGQAAEYEYYDLRGRFFFNPAPAEPAYRHAVATASGWTIRPIDLYQLNFVNAQGQGWRRALDAINERRWWAYTVIPPGPGHADPVAAVAVDMGVVLWNLRTGEKTRSLSGHAGPVYAIASSPDGKWLLTGSADQTVRLWPLASCDRIPPFGAKFERQPEGWVVTEVTPGGFAEGIPLKPGNIVESVEVGDFGRPVLADLAVILPRLDAESPTKTFTFTYKTPGQQGPAFQVARTKRDSPALTLFPGVDRRWILWTPRGYYDSSADGDRKFLGWLTNRGTVAQLLAGTYDSIDKFEPKFRQLKAPGNVLDRLLDTADPLQAVANLPANPALPPPADPTTSRLETLTLTPVTPAPTDRPVAVASPTILVNYRARSAAGAAPIREMWVEVDGRRLPSLLPANGPPVPDVEGRLEVRVGLEREVRASLVAIDTQGVRRSERLDLINQAPAPVTARKSRLVVIAMGAADFADKRLTRVEHADEDARDLAKFLENRLIDPATGARFGPEQVQIHTFLGPGVSKSPILATFDELKAEVQAGKLGSSDVVALVVESHFLDFRSSRLLVTAEPDVNDGEPPALSATDLADRLGELTKLGCRSFVLVDAVHEIKGEAWENDIREWVRQLQTQAGAAVFIASDHAPSSPNGKGHRIFAQGVLDSLNASTLIRRRKPGAPFTLYEFEKTVVTDVLEKTKRNQHAQLYLPESLSYQIQILDASPR
jgi:WD40 repeat protein